jgi:hypothetical protein
MCAQILRAIPNIHFHKNPSRWSGVVPRGGEDGQTKGRIGGRTDKWTDGQAYRSQ